MRSFESSNDSLRLVCLQLKTSIEKGLSPEDILERQKTYGENRIKIEAVSPFAILLRQFASPFVYLLLGAGILAFFLGEYPDAILIGLFLVINSLLGFVQEYRSERTAEDLRKFAAPLAHVIRGGQRLSIPARELVPGDIVFLETGDKVPADIRLCSLHGLSVDESILTGESLPAQKVIEGEKGQSQLSPSMVFSGTTIVSGSAEGVVVHTGGKTMIGDISNLAAETKKESSFEVGMLRFSSFILKLVVATLLFVLIVNLILKGDDARLGDLLLFSIALAVSVIPEALPVVTTFSLSRGAHELARQKVIVKRLSAIEDLGGIEILCTDKTGTITENKLLLDSYAPHTKKSFLITANQGAALVFGKRTGEPFDDALKRALSEEDRNKIFERERLYETPFDPETRLNAVLLSGKGETGIIVIRGALSAILSRVRLQKRTREDILAWEKKVGASGRRILAVAERKISNITLYRKKDADLLSGIFTFTGAAAFEDPVKPSTKHAVSAAKKLGIEIKMITGDAPEVAGAVARDIGLITKEEDLITGDEFEALSFPMKKEAVVHYSVFARTTPRVKYEIINLLRDQATVGFLGEGINDAPALKAAHVSLVVESASDVAREASDIILLKKSLNVIIEGIEKGRTVFANTSKYIRATLASNFGNFYAVAAVSLFVVFLPMLPVQILLLNLLSDVPLIAIATDRVKVNELTKPLRYDVREIMWMATVFGIVSTIFDFIYFSLFVREGASVLQTNWFLGSLLTELFFVYSIRSLLPVYRAGLPSVPLIVLTVIALVLGFAAPFLSVTKELFGFVQPTFGHLILIVGVAVVYFIATEIVKGVYRRTGGFHFSLKEKTEIV